MGKICIGTVNFFSKRQIFALKSTIFFSQNSKFFFKSPNHSQNNNFFFLKTANFFFSKRQKNLKTTKKLLKCNFANQTLAFSEQNLYAREFFRFFKIFFVILKIFVSLRKYYEFLAVLSYFQRKITCLDIFQDWFPVNINIRFEWNDMKLFEVKRHFSIFLFNP